MREFTTAIEEAHDDTRKDPQQMMLDGRVLTYYFPTEGQYLMFTADTGRRAPGPQMLGATVDLFVGLFAHEDQIYLSGRLLDTSDPFGYEQLQEMFEAIIEDWSGRPTQPSADSSTSQTSGGRKSTRRTPAST